jgi:iron-regulated transporter 1
MRRIDLFCKLAGPLFVSVLTLRSTAFAAVFLAVSNVISLPFEYWFILVVYKRFPDLAVKSFQEHTPNRPLQWPKKTYSSWKVYYQSSVFAASLALCILYLTVLSFGGIAVSSLTQAP